MKKLRKHVKGEKYSSYYLLPIDSFLFFLSFPNWRQDAYIKCIFRNFHFFLYKYLFIFFVVAAVVVVIPLIFFFLLVSDPTTYAFLVFVLLFTIKRI